MRALLTILLLFVAGCAREEGSESVPVRRLLDGSEVVEVLWPEVAEPPGWLDAPHLAAVPAPGRAARIPMFAAPGHLDSRAALLAPSGSEYRFVLELPTGRPELQLALGYLLLPETAGRELLFRVLIDGEALLEERILTSEDDAWRERRLDLSEWAGDEVELSLSVEGELVWAGWGVPEVHDPSRATPVWDVILISIDTLRADALGVYGSPRPTSPNLDRLAADGWLFNNAESQAPWTRPSHRTLFTGLLPDSVHGLSSQPLALRLWEAGYRTAALTGGGQMDSRFGFHLGFESYAAFDWLREPERAVSWLEAAPGRSSLLFLHTFEVHDPYDHSRFAEGLPAGRLAPGFSKHTWNPIRAKGGSLTEEERDYVRALYDSGVAFMDERLGVLVDVLRERGILDRAIVVVTSDHGEQFWEHGLWRHGGNLYQHQLRIPLIVHLPAELRDRYGRGVVEEPVRLIDLYPTLLDLLDIPLARPVQGRSFRNLLEGRAEDPGRETFAENVNTPKVERKSLRVGPLKLIATFPRSPAEGGKIRWELFDLAEDPGEQNDLAGERPEELARLQSRLLAIADLENLEVRDEEVPKDIGEELREQLEALGYLGN